jgi:hypothetical protein
MEPPPLSRRAAWGKLYKFKKEFDPVYIILSNDVKDLMSWRGHQEMATMISMLGFAVIMFLDAALG